jgi:methionyl-tRNA synthetase
MVERYCEGIVPPGLPNEVDAADALDYRRYHDAIGGSRGYQLNEALRSVWLTVARGNEYVDRQAPWKLARDPAERRALDDVLATLVRQLIRQAIHVAPFMPGRAEELWRQLGGHGSVHDQRIGAAAGPLDPTGWRVVRGPPLFPKPATTDSGPGAS